MYEANKPTDKKNKKNKNIFIPETKIKANHTIVISRVCPKSGCEIKDNNIGKRIIALKKYLKYSFLLFKDNNADIIIIKKGFNISIGWNLGKIPRSNHLLDPFTSIPKKGTKTKLIRVTKNKIVEILTNISWFKKEKKNKIIIPKIIKTKCFMKK